MDRNLLALIERLKAEHYDANQLFDNSEGGTQILAVAWLNTVERAINSAYALGKTLYNIEEAKKDIVEGGN